MVANKPEETNPLFEVSTPLDFTVRTSQDYWQKIVNKHPDLTDRQEKVKQALISPVEIRQSRRNDEVLLFYLTIVRPLLSSNFAIIPQFLVLGRFFNQI